MTGLGGRDGAVKVLIVRVLGELGVALGFAFVVVEMQHATCAPVLLLREQVLQQAAGVAVACEQQLGLGGGVGGDFGVEQSLLIA